MNRTREQEEALREEALENLREEVNQLCWLAEAANRSAIAEKWDEAHQHLLSAERNLDRCLRITASPDQE